MGFLQKNSALVRELGFALGGEEELDIEFLFQVFYDFAQCRLRDIELLGSDGVALVNGDLDKIIELLYIHFTDTFLFLQFCNFSITITFTKINLKLSKL